jgi:hypothetical protein
MALIPLKARAGIAALTFAPAGAPFVSATSAKAYKTRSHYRRCPSNAVVAVASSVAQLKLHVGVSGERL